MNCKICGHENHVSFTGEILNKYVVNYYNCSSCDFIQTEDPYWLNESYSKSINLSDTGYMARNVFYSRRLTVLLYLLFGRDGYFLDYAGGYGVFVRLMRDIGFDFNWDDRYTENIFAVGFEWKPGVKVDAVTLFEVFEHFVNPIEEIEHLLAISDTIIFSTELHPCPTPLPRDWWYYGLDHGQHIAFYSKKTFEFIANKFCLDYFSIGSLHILTRKKIPSYAPFAIKLARFGLARLIAKRLESKTWTDYELMIKKGLT